MIPSTSFVSLLMTICLLYSMTLLRARAHTLPHPQVTLALLKNDGTPSGNYFADFLRVLYGPQTANDESSMSAGAVNEMSNDVFPLMMMPDAIENGAHDDIYESHRQQEFPKESGVLLPILQKRNARYCGSYLADALRMACSRSSYLPLFGKRSISAGKSTATTEATADRELGSWPFINDDKAHSILSNQHLFHRFTRGVHDECCVKGCTFKELTSYCTRPN